jgi:hypothetical protein
MAINKVVKYFVPLNHNVEYDQDNKNSTYNMISRIDSFLVNKTLAGNVTITTTGQGQGNVDMLTSANIFSEYTFDATAFTQGQVYDIYIKKVQYSNAGDQANPPLIGLV